MTLNNKDIQALFNRKTSSADILAEKDVKEERELNSWDDMFTDLFELNVEGKNILATPKALLDGFTDSGLLTDDNHQVVVYTKYCYGGLSGTTGYKLEVEFDKVNS